MKRRFDTIMLAFSLFCISGAMLFYNLRAAGGMSVSSSPGELMEQLGNGAIAVSARARLQDFDEGEQSDSAEVDGMNESDCEKVAVGQSGTSEADTDRRNSQDGSAADTEAALLPPIVRAIEY